jgi:cell division protein FtsI/penicillin-binding protein 2
MWPTRRLLRRFDLAYSESMTTTPRTKTGRPQGAGAGKLPLPMPAPAPDGNLDDQDETGSGDANALSPGRPLFLMVIFLIILVAVVARLVHWTVFPAPTQAAVGGAVGNAATPARGRIIDRNGILLATDTFAGKVYARPDKIAAEGAAGQSLVITTTQALGQSPENLQAALAAGSPLEVLTNTASAAQCEAIQNINAPNQVWCDFERERAYPQGTIAAHVLGFTNVEHKGLYGVEERYDDWLNSSQAWPGSLPSVADPLPEAWKLYLPSPAGRDLMLNLDVPLQYMVERRLEDSIARYQAEAGTIIVMNPRTGAVLALANYPTFDPGHFSDASPNTWVNPAISEIYEPGSVFKLVTIAGGVDSGYITPDSMFVDEGALKIGGRLIRNAEQRAYGPVSIRDALAHSINVVSAKVSLRMGAETFYSYVRQFGFGRLTEADLQAEVGGIVNQPGRGAGWSQYDQAANSFGQGISVTALQMIDAAAAIANRGVLMQPQVVGAMVENGQVHAIPPRALGRPIQPESARTLAQMMVYTVENSSTPNPIPGYRVAGKTGTAEIPTKEGYTSLQSIMSFIGFLPAADPQLIIMVKLVKPKTAKWAEQVAVPVFAQVGQDAVQILEIKPNNAKP